jgi:hypothetical protein
MNPNLTKAQRRRLRELGGIAYARSVGGARGLNRSFDDGEPEGSTHSAWRPPSMPSTKGLPVSCSRRTAIPISILPLPAPSTAASCRLRKLALRSRNCLASTWRSCGTTRSRRCRTGATPGRRMLKCLKRC